MTGTDVREVAPRSCSCLGPPEPSEFGIRTADRAPDLVLESSAKRCPIDVHTPISNLVLRVIPDPLSVTTSAVAAGSKLTVTST